MDEFYNKHYITTDTQGRITDGWSDGPQPGRDTTDAICINEQGGYQFRLSPGGEENPALYTMDGIPLYKWSGSQAVPRTEGEIAADRVPPIEIVRADKLAELSAACNAVITAGCGVTLTDGSSDSAMTASSGHAELNCAQPLDAAVAQYTGHISLTAEDQINLTNACAAVEGGAEAYPYHLDGQLCALYSAADILAMARAATAHKLYHTTYYNHLAAWVRRCETAEEAQGITYGAELPDDLAANMAAILDSAMTASSGHAELNCAQPLDVAVAQSAAAGGVSDAV